ncbi:hypothetical protein BDY24DRAFT_392886 [Mrakia frigida]|uniref:uncharacterized protein n=1 Tax=Mrakia frigida TaxID=29902 RepID=UPI003FCC1933
MEGTASLQLFEGWMDAREEKRKKNVELTTLFPSLSPSLQHITTERETLLTENKELTSINSTLVFRNTYLEGELEKVNKKRAGGGSSGRELSDALNDTDHDTDDFRRLESFARGSAFIPFPPSVNHNSFRKASHPDVSSWPKASRLLCSRSRLGGCMRLRTRLPDFLLPFSVRPPRTKLPRLQQLNFPTPSTASQTRSSSRSFIISISPSTSSTTRTPSLESHILLLDRHLGIQSDFNSSAVDGGTSLDLSSTTKSRSTPETSVPFVWVQRSAKGASTTILSRPQRSSSGRSMLGAQHRDPGSSSNASPTETRKTHPSIFSSSRSQDYLETLPKGRVRSRPPSFFETVRPPTSLR